MFGGDWRAKDWRVTTAALGAANKAALRDALASIRRCPRPFRLALARRRTSGLPDGLGKKRLGPLRTGSLTTAALGAANKAALRGRPGLDLEKLARVRPFGPSSANAASSGLT